MDLNAYVAWLSDRDFQKANPQHFAILNVRKEEKDIVMDLTGQVGFRAVTLWGDNQNILIKAFGKNTDAWLGRKISISQVIDASTGKKNKIIEVSQ